MYIHRAPHRAYLPRDTSRSRTPGRFDKARPTRVARSRSCTLRTRSTVQLRHWRRYRERDSCAPCSRCNARSIGSGQRIGYPSKDRRCIRNRTDTSDCMSSSRRAHRSCRSCSHRMHHPALPGICPRSGCSCRCHSLRLPCRFRPRRPSERSPRPAHSGHLDTRNSSSRYPAPHRRTTPDARRRSCSRAAHHELRIPARRSDPRRERRRTCRRNRRRCCTHVCRCVDRTPGHSDNRHRCGRHRRWHQIPRVHRRRCRRMRSVRQEPH